MNLWDEIEMLDDQIIETKIKVKALMKERDGLYTGLCHLKEDIPKEKEELSVPEIVLQNDFIPPTQEEVARKRQELDAKFPPPKRIQQTHE